MRLGVLGGTFDPIHVGHLILAEQAREELDLDQVLFVPAGDPWRKAGRSIAPAIQRVAMVQLAIAGVDEYSLAMLEAQRGGPSYTVETLEVFALQYKGAELFFILGQDTLADLPNWRRPERIVELAVLAVARRSGFEFTTEEVLAGKVVAIEGRIRWLTMPLIEITASDIRERVRLGRSIRFLVPPGVEEYIRRQRLYVEA